MTWKTLGRRFAVFLGGLLIVAGGAAGEALESGQPYVDATVPGYTVGGERGQTLAQIVVAEHAGQVAELRLPVECVSGTLTVELRGVRDGRPGPQVLSTAILYPGGSGPAGGQLVARFPHGPRFSSGEAFAVVISSTGACEVSPGPVGDTYLGGSAYYRDEVSAEGSWEPLGDRDDLPFQVLQRQSPERVVVIIDLDEETDDERARDEEEDEHRSGSFVRVSCFLQVFGLDGWR